MAGRRTTHYSEAFARRKTVLEFAERSRRYDRVACFGLLGFEFDERFSLQMDEEKRRRICDIHSRREAGITWRGIAAELGISRSWACDLYKKWTPAMASNQQSAASNEQEDEDDRWDETEISAEASEWLEEEFPIAHSPLSVGYDGYGQQILVESREEHTGKPTVWYQVDRRTTRRFTRGTFGIQVEHLNAGPFL